MRVSKHGRPEDEAASQRPFFRCVGRGFLANVFFSQLSITPAMASLFFSSIIMWPLPRMPMLLEPQERIRHAGLREIGRGAVVVGRMVGGLRHQDQDRHLGEIW